MPIHTFNSPKELLDYLKHLERQADSRIQPWQKELKPGDYFIRLYPFHAGEILVIYGLIYESPYEEDRAYFAQPHMRNKRLAMCYSAVELLGEIGTVHISTMHIKITKDQFEAARARGFGVTQEELKRLIKERYPQVEFTP